ncbi:MAG: redoxin domain-containing protein [Butyrivibrio sp.]|nr:redoxin domain-containing protein [Butyrivibrio sp.]
MKKLGKIIVAVLAIIGVLFIALLLIPEDEEDTADVDTVTEQVVENEIQEETDGDAEQVTEENVTEDVESENTTDEASEDNETNSGAFSFSTVDLEGNTVTDDILKDKDYTMINIWATFCGPCINEMPELAAIAQELPGNMQMVGIISDVYEGSDENVELAQQILDETGAGVYTNVRLSEDLYTLISEYQFVPTTIFVDSNGNMIGEAIVGANIDAYKERIEEYGE